MLYGEAPIFIMLELPLAINNFNDILKESLPSYIGGGVILEQT
jgi:hypothetical protein